MKALQANSTKKNNTLWIFFYHLHINNYTHNKVMYIYNIDK